MTRIASHTSAFAAVRGVGLIEVLVALLLISIGMLGRGLPSAESVGGSAATSTTAGAAATVTDGGKPAVSTDESDQKAIAELTGKAVEEEKKTSTTSEETSTTPEETSTTPRGDV